MAIAVNDLDAAIDWYAEVFGAAVDHREVVESATASRRRCSRWPTPTCQLLTPITRHLPGGQVPGQQGRGPAPHRLPGRRLRRALQAIKDAGGGSIDRRPGPVAGHHGGVRPPQDLFGTLIELVQRLRPTSFSRRASSVPVRPITLRRARRHVLTADRSTTSPARRPLLLGAGRIVGALQSPRPLTRPSNSSRPAPRPSSPDSR